MSNSFESIIGDAIATEKVSITSRPTYDQKHVVVSLEFILEPGMAYELLGLAAVRIKEEAARRTAMVPE